jgi:hypothetical protein
MISVGSPNRRSRFSLDPLDYTLRLTARDIAILRLFDDYRLLPTNWIRAFFPEADPIGLRNRLTALTKEPHTLLGRFTFNGTKNVNETMTYFRTTQGDRLLISKGYPPLVRSGLKDAHQVLCDLVDASIALGVRAEPNLELITWRDLLNHPKVPEATKRLSNPFSFTLGDRRLTPDGRPFIIKRRDTNQSILFFKEIDRHTEPLAKSELRASIAAKFDGYRRVFEGRLYTSQFGHGQALVLIVTTNVQHMRNMMEVAAEVGIHRSTLFQTIHDHTVHGETAPVTIRFLTEGWQRQGYPAFSLKMLAECA